MRVDSHIYKDYKIPPFYDSLLAKLIVKSTGNDLVVNKLERALKEFKIEGVQTIIPFLLAISKSREFRRGFFDTSYVESNLQKILDATDDSMNPKKKDDEVVAAVSAVMQMINEKK